jgi:tetratricopeptide (TPR) repeat protein
MTDEVKNFEDMLIVLQQSHRQDMIIDTAKKLLSIAPDNLIGLYSLTSGYINSHKYKEAFETAQAAIKTYPNDPEFYYFMFYYYLSIGGEEYVNAKKVLEKAIFLKPNDPRFWRELAEIYLINWEPQKAVVSLENAVSLHPERAEYRSRYALALLRTKKKEESLEVAAKAISDEPDDHKVLDSVGMVYILSGELDKAEELFRDALRRHPTYEYYQKHLDWVLREKQDKESRNRQGKGYTPLYLRQKGEKRFFDEDKIKNNEQ